MSVQTIEFCGVGCAQLENDHVEVKVALHSGNILDLVNKVTGHHQFWIKEDLVAANTGEYGLKLPWIAAPELVEQGAGDGGEPALTMRAAAGGLVQTIAFALDAQCPVLTIRQTMQNVSAESRFPDPRAFYFFNVASRAERTGILCVGGPKWHSVTAAHCKHRLFVGREPRWPGEIYWANSEAGWGAYEPSSYGETVWLRPRWFAAVDSEAREGVAVRFERRPGFVRSWTSGIGWSYALAFEQDFNIGELSPGQSRTFEMEVALLNGLARVDHVSGTCGIEIGLTAALRLQETQGITLRAAAFRPGRLEARVLLRTDRIEWEDAIDWHLAEVGQVSEGTWECGPYGGREELEKIWYYADKKPGDCSRPTPRVEIHTEGERAERWFAPSPDNEEILDRMESALSGMDLKVRSGDAPRELASAVRVFLKDADDLRRERIDPEGMYDLLDKAESAAGAEITDAGFRLFDRTRLPAAAKNPIAARMVAGLREEVNALPDSSYELPAPGRLAFMPTFELASHAAGAAVCGICLADEDCRRRAVRALSVFADQFERYRLTGSGAILHLAHSVPDLVAAYDLVSDLMSEEQEAKLLRYFFWLAGVLEGHVHAKGDNDEIHEAGAIAWLAARFPYLPSSRRAMRRAHAVLCRQARVIDDDGGWPECPNYNAQITSAYMVHAALLKRTRLRIDQGDTGRSLRRLLDWFTQVLTPDFRVPMLGDGTELSALPSAVFFLGASLFQDGRFLSEAVKLFEHENRHPEQFLSQGRQWMAILDFPDQIEPREVELPGAAVLPHTGYILLRSGSGPDAEFLVADYGHFKPGHGHLDKLSFEFYASRENLIRDTGYGFHSTADHNLVLVDGQDQGPICGELEILETREDGTVRAAARAEVLPGVTHRRLFLYLPTKWLLVHDSLDSRQEHEYSWRVHLNGRARVDGERFVYQSPGGLGVLVVPLGARARLENASATTFSQRSGIGHRPIDRIVMTTRGRSKQFLALFVPFEDGVPEASLAWECDAPCATVKVRGSVWEVELH